MNNPNFRTQPAPTIGEKIVEQSLRSLDPVTENKVVTIKGVNAVVIRNSGAKECEINGYTLAAGESISFNTDNPYIVINARLRISFAAGAGAEKVEFMVLETVDPVLSHYVEHAKFRP